jgi:hypothetical protein
MFRKAMRYIILHFARGLVLDNLLSRARWPPAPKPFLSFCCKILLKYSPLAYMVLKSITLQMHNSKLESRDYAYLCFSPPIGVLLIKYRQ